MGEQREENSGTYEVTKVGEDTVDLNLTLGRSEDDQSTKAVVTFLNDDQILFVPAETKRDSLVLKRSSKKEMQEVLSAENS